MAENTIEKISNGFYKIMSDKSKARMVDTLFSASDPVSLENLEEELHTSYEEGSDFFIDINELQKNGIIKRLPLRSSPTYCLTELGKEVAVLNNILKEKIVIPLAEKKLKKLLSGEEKIPECFLEKRLDKEIKDYLEKFLNN